MRSMFQRMWRSPGLWSMASASLRAGGGIITLPLALHWIPQTELGLHYTFLGLATLGLILDLGFGQTLSRFSSYAWAGAKTLQSHGVPSSQGNGKPNLELLRQLILSVRSFYRMIALLALLLLGIPGGWFVAHEIRGAGLPESLLYCWLLTTVGVGLELALGFWRTVLFGTGGLRQAHRVIVLSNIISITALASGLIAGLGIWSWPISRLLMVLIQWVGSFLSVYRRVSIPRLTLTESGDLHLIGTMWPMAWRSGVMALGSFITLRSTTVICTLLFGLEATATYGLTMQVIGVLAAISLAPTAVIVPLIADLRVSDNSREIVRLFGSRLYPGLVFLLGLGGLAIWLGPMFLDLISSRTELLPPALMIPLLVILILEHHHTAWSWVVLTENHNPLVLPVIISGAAVIVSALLLGRVFGLPGMIAAHGLVHLCFNNWWIVRRGFHGLKMSFSEFMRCLLHALQHPLTPSQRASSP